MSHLQTLEELKNACDNTGNCTEYHAQLRQEESKADMYTAEANQSAVTWGILLGIIGLIILLTPFIKLLQRFQKFSLPKLAVAAPVIIGLVAGAFLGFAVSFGACYKQSCSPVESSAMFTIPAVSLIITIPLAKRIYSKKQGISESISHPKPLGWVIVGSLIIIFAITNAASTISNNNRNNISEKNYLRTLEP